MFFVQDDLLLLSLSCSIDSTYIQASELQKQPDTGLKWEMSDVRDADMRTIDSNE